jgi:DNA-directed RNA polymerase subunit RPC12/RpoP
MSEYGRAKAKGKSIFMFDEWQAARQEADPSRVVSEEKTGKIAFKCLSCSKISIYPAQNSDGRTCAHCNGRIVTLGYAKAGMKTNEP